MNRRLTTDSESVFIGLVPPTLNSATSMVRTTMLYVKTRPRFGGRECYDAEGRHYGTRRARIHRDC